MDAEELGKVSLFSELSEDDVRALATYADEVTVSEGKHLVDEGGYAYDLFVIVEGRAEVIVGGDVTVAIQDGGLDLGRWQGIYFAEFDGPRTRSATVTVIGERAG